MVRRTSSLLMAAVLMIGACAGDDDDSLVGSETSGDQAQDTMPESTSDGSASVPAMFDFVADDVRGGEVIGAEFADRDVVVWFWAPWCTSCNREAPDIAALVAERGDDVAFLGMAGLADEGDMADFVQRHRLSEFPHAIDTDGSIWSTFGVTSQSVFVFVNDDGTVTRTEFGVQGRDSLEAAIDDLLAA